MESKRKLGKVAEKYSKDLNSEDLVQEINHMFHNANFGLKHLGALELLNALAEYRLVYFPTSVSV